MLTEAAYQAKLIKKLEIMFPGCYILKNDPALNQGLPDLLILIRDRWAQLEVKLSAQAPMQPNQEYYVNLFDNMSFASFIWPAIERDVLAELKRVLG